MNKDITYSSNEIELFKILEHDIDKGKYQPLSTQQLPEKKSFFKAVAISTILNSGIKKKPE